MGPVDIDTALDQVGGYRRWNIGVFALLSISTFIPLCWQGLSIVFIGWEPDYHCKVNMSLPLNESIPYLTDSDRPKLDQCHQYDPTQDRNLGTNRSIVACVDGWHYYNDGYETVVTEFDLVCENNFLSEMSQFIYQVGCLCAEVGVSYFIDKFGRRNMHVVSQMLVCVLGIGVAFTQSYVAFVVMRAIVGFAVVATLLSGITLLMEIFDSTRRAFAGIGLEFGWLVLYIIMPGLAFLIKDWRMFQLTISLCSCVWVIYFWIVPESAVWFASYKQYTKSEKVLNKMAKLNGLRGVTVTLAREDTPGMLLNGGEKGEIEKEMQIKESKEEEEEGGSHHVPIADVFRDPVMRKMMFVSSLFWFANCVVYYGLILSTPSLAGDRFVNFLLMAIIELPAYFITFAAVDRIGRRWPLLVFHIIAGIPLAVAPFVPEPTDDLDLSWLSIALAMTAKFGITGSFAVMVLFTKEIFPTNLRGTCGGLNNVMGRVGNMIAPFAAYANKEISWVPNIAFAVISIGSGFLVFFLPETLNKPLPQTLDDVYRIFYNKQYQERVSSQDNIHLEHKPEKT